jgi:uncharacterized protein YbjQ (UPF0145 family)
MNKRMCLVLTAFLVHFASTAYARDDIGDYSIEDALSLEQAKSITGSDVKFYFGNQPHGKVEKSFGQYKSNKKTNAFGKSATTACQWAFLSAMQSLKERAIKEGGNAVINIKSNYKDVLTSSTKTFQCGSGAVIAGVALMGDVVKIK